MACPGLPHRVSPTPSPASPAGPTEPHADPCWLDPADQPAGRRNRMLVAYGLGDAGTGMAASLIGFYLFVFYTKAAGLPPGWPAWC